MHDEQREAAMQAQYDGMRAMGNEEMARRQLEAAGGARNAYPEITSWQLAHGSQNWGAQCRSEVPVEPIRIQEIQTLWARFKRWLLA